MSASRLRVPQSAPRDASPLVRMAERAAAAWHRVPAVVAAGRGRILRQRAAAQFRKIPTPYRLCLGSGRAPIAGWTNVDFYFPATVSLDLRFGLPIPDGSAELIYSEHLIEHLPLDASLRLFRECRRALAVDGRMRIATPDLDEIVRAYASDWRRHDWVKWDEYQWIDSGTRMVNTAVREWGHLYIWDFDELARRLDEAGFVNIQRYGLGDSDTEQLRDLETRADSRLIVEADPGKAPF